MSQARATATLLAVLLVGCSRSAGPSAAASVSPSTAASSSAAAEDPARPLPSPIPDVVARVNGQPVYIAQIVPLAKAELDRVPATERERQQPKVLRHALSQYVDRELLFQEAVARGIKAQTRDVEWAYDQARKEHRNDQDWAEFLAKQGLDVQSFRAELRIQHTVAALVEEEARTFVVPEAWSRAAYDADPSSFTQPGAAGAQPFEQVRGQIEQAIRAQRRDLIGQDLLKRVRARARVETYL